MNLEVVAACGSLLDGGGNSSAKPILFSDTETFIVPEQAVQYYRASSAVLTLDTYNNTATYAVEGTADSPLPSNANYGLLSCLNGTIGSTLPLIDGAIGLNPLPSINLVGLVGLFWWLSWTL
ncbi:hypothetical protein MD484_g4649, partial [Candolleomyces efflorescens]